MNDYTNQFNMNWKKNQFGGIKVVRKATMLAHWAQKVGGGLPPCPIGSTNNDTGTASGGLGRMPPHKQLCKH